MASNILGGPYNGFSAKQTINSNKDNQDAIIRKILRNSWNNINSKDSINNYNRVITPYRAINNAGDYLSRTNYSCGGPNPTNKDKPGWKIGSIWNNCDNTNIPPTSCNTKYVYDCSEYIRFKKQTAYNKNYNDLGYGGYNNAAYNTMLMNY